MSQAAGRRDVRVRFHYLGSWSQWWQVDDVFVGGRTCAPVAGGLVTGQVADETGAGVTGADVAGVSKPDEHTSTFATPDDPNLGDGAYWLFSTATGQQSFTASKPGHTSHTTTTTVVADQAAKLDFTLPSSRPGSAAGAPHDRARHRRPRQARGEVRSPSRPASSTRQAEASLVFAAPGVDIVPAHGTADATVTLDANDLARGGVRLEEFRTPP